MSEAEAASRLRTYFEQELDKVGSLMARKERDEILARIYAYQLARTNAELKGQYASQGLWVFAATFRAYRPFDHSEEETFMETWEFFESGATPRQRQVR